MKDSEKMRPLFNDSVDELQAVISGKKEISETTKLAVKILPAYGKVLQSENARGGLGFRIYERFYDDDKEAFRNAIVNMQPDILPAQPKQLAIRKNK